MIYGPTSDEYWNEPVRIVALNMEPYGYDGSGLYPVDLKVLMDWIYAKGRNRPRTARYTFALMSTIISHLENNITPSQDLCRKAHSDEAGINRTLARTAYYNIRPDSNSKKNQDFGAIASVGTSELGRLIWKEIRALDPHLLLVSGKAGLVALNNLIGMNAPIKFRDSYAHPDGFLIQSIAHPSRPKYHEWVKVVEGIWRWKKETSFNNESSKC